MPWEHPPPEVVLADQLRGAVAVPCPVCGALLDPFEVQDDTDDHDCAPPDSSS